jgi:hypothetical protein
MFSLRFGWQLAQVLRKRPARVSSPDLEVAILVKAVAA